MHIAHVKCKMGGISCISIGPNETTHLNLITNPRTPLQMHPTWLGQRVHPNHWGSRMHPNYWGSRVHPNSQGSWMHPNGRGSQAWPGWGSRCALASPSRLVLHARGSGFARLKTSRQTEMQYVFYTALQYKTDKSKRRIVGFRWEQKLQLDRPHPDREVILRKTDFNFFSHLISIDRYIVGLISTGKFCIAATCHPP
jgi:hypothetical protein